MKQKTKRGVAIMLLMTALLIGGFSIAAKAIDPPDIEPLTVPSTPQTEQM